MKAAFVLFMIVFASLAIGLAQENPDPESTQIRAQAAQLLNEEKYIEYIRLLDTALYKFPTHTRDILQSQTQVLKKLNGDKSVITEYIGMLDRALPKFPSCRLEVLQAKLQALEELSLDRDAALIAVEIDPLLPEGGRKVNSAAEIAWRFSALKDGEKAFHWMKVSADRGYQNFNYYLKIGEFALLRKDKRFAPLVVQIKNNAGIGRAAKSFFRTDVAGDTVSLEQLRGKVVLIDFWATWCPPCVEAMPELQRLYAEFKDQGLEIVGFSVDADKSKLLEFLKKQKILWPTVCDGKGWDDETRSLYNVASVPACFLVDRQGILRFYQLKGEALRQAIAELIKK